MKLAPILGGLVFASAVVLLFRRVGRKAGTKPRDPYEGVAAAERRDYFSVTRSRSKTAHPQWVLQGFGQCQCFLFFHTWQEAMDQASFRLESLGRNEILIQIGSIPSK